jgi:DNA polymerase I
MKKLLLIDTFNFLHRAYHALPKTFKDPSGSPTNAVYGVTSMIINVLDQIKPDYVVAALDGEKPTFRVEDFTGYKAHRHPMEDDLSVQIPKVFEILDAFGINKIVVDGYEADDVIGTAAKKFGDKLEVVIVSNDKDMWQLIGKNVMIMVPDNKGGVNWLGKKEAEARLGFDISKVADYKGLRGDPSDNIPGVFGVGEKTAQKLIQQYGSLEEIYKKIDTVEPATLREKLLNCYEQALMSKKLAQIIDVPFEINLEDCHYREINKVKVKEVLEKYNFKSLIRRLGFETDEDVKGKKTKTASVNDSQLGLF